MNTILYKTPNVSIDTTPDGLLVTDFISGIERLIPWAEINRAEEESVGFYW